MEHLSDICRVKATLDFSTTFSVRVHYSLAVKERFTKFNLVFSAPLFVTMEVLFMLGYNPSLAKQCEDAVLKKLPKKAQ